jgi:hypothetical protein
MHCKSEAAPCGCQALCRLTAKDRKNQNVLTQRRSNSKTVKSKVSWTKLWWMSTRGQKGVSEEEQVQVGEADVLWGMMSLKEGAMQARSSSGPTATTTSPKLQSDNKRRQSFPFHCLSNNDQFQHWAHGEAVF